MIPSDCIIFLTDKRGKGDRTKEIRDISYNKKSGLYSITFVSGKQFNYKKENVEIIRNCIKDSNSVAVFDYFQQMAQFNDIKNEDGQNLLEKTLENIGFINEKSALYMYLNPKIRNNCGIQTKPLIFPFGCNSSQYKAVSTAISNRISIIQGPPGTGKTQTILNIIANLLINNKTVLVVSNNNDATANVYEKLSSEKYGLGFICATCGNTKNTEDFIKNQQRFYPEYLKEWSSQLRSFSVLSDNEIKTPGTYFEANERISSIKAELSALETETEYFNSSIHDIYSNKKLLRKSSSRVMSLLQDVQYTYAEKEKLPFLKKLILKIKYGLGAKKFKESEAEKVIETIKTTYYELKKKELNNELIEKNKIINSFNPSDVYEKSLKVLHSKIAQKYSKNQERIQFMNKKEIYSRPKIFVNEYPIVLSTTFSSNKIFRNKDGFLFDYVIMDEASQVDIVTGALSLSCAKNAVIVGDKKQLPNVIEESKKKTIQEIFDKTGLHEGYNYIHSFLDSLELILPETPQTLLREHYRCHPKIINFCNYQFYGGKLLIMTEDKGEVDVIKAVKTIQGNFCKDHYNQRQIDVITKEILPKFTERDMNSIGIITPYNKQVEEIKRNISGVDVATVHKFQGREKDNIIISTVDNKITSFSDDSNMLNVAISRAKKKLAVVISGNEQPKNSNLMSLIKYIQYNNFEIEESKVESVFDFFYTKENEAKMQFLKSLKKISLYDSENVMGALLAKIFNETNYSRFGFFFEMPLKSIINKKFFGELPEELFKYASNNWAHVDFIVYNRVTKEILFGIEVDGYKYHKEGTIQAERDKKKEKIFQLIGLPLLRMSTKGSGEEERIKEQLAQYVNQI